MNEPPKAPVTEVRNPHVVPVLTTAKDKGATKTHTPQGTVSYSAGHVFTAEFYWARNQKEAVDLFQWLQTQGQKFVIRGAPRDDIPEEWTYTNEKGTWSQTYTVQTDEWKIENCSRRQVEKYPKEDGGLWMPCPRAWFMFDHDNEDEDLAGLMLVDSEAIAKNIWPYEEAGFIWALGGSTGIKKEKVSYHLVGLLDEPLSDEEIKPKALELGFDGALFSENQVHFTAGPVFKDMADPVKVPRFGVIEGGQVKDSEMKPKKGNLAEFNLKLEHSEATQKGDEWPWPRAGETLEQARERASSYLKKKHPAVSGQQGHSSQLEACLTLTNGFNIRDREEVKSLFMDWDKNSRPPLEKDSDINHKVDDALNIPPKNGKPRGYLNAPNFQEEFTDHEPEIPADTLKERSFPTEVFPPPIKEFIHGFSHGSGAPESFVAAGVLACLAGIIADSSLEVKYGYIEKPNLYLAVVGAPGVAKTPPLKASMNPLFQSEKRIAKEFQEKKAEYEKQLKEAKNKKEREAIPKPSREPSRLITDGTTEGLLMHLNAMHEGNSSPHAVYFRDELKGHFGGMDKYKSKGSGDDYELWLTLFSGGMVNRVLKTESHFIPDARASVIGGIQPDVYLKHMQDKGDGMIDRFLVAFHPAEPPQTTIFNHVEKEVIEAYNNFMEYLDKKLHTSYSLWNLPQGVRGDVLRSVESFHEWAHMVGMENDAGAFKKWEQNFYRLIIHMANIWEKEAVDIETVRRASTLTKYYAEDWIESRLAGEDEKKHQRQDERMMRKLEEAKGLGCTRSDFSRYIRDFKGKEKKQALDEGIQRLVDGGQAIRNKKGRVFLKAYLPKKETK